METLKEILELVKNKPLVYDPVIETIDDKEYVKFTTPFLDKSNDIVQLYISYYTGVAYIISDMGYTLSFLKITGMEIDETKILHTALQHSADIINQEIQSKFIIYADTLDFDKAYWNIARAILLIDNFGFIGNE